MLDGKVIHIPQLLTTEEAGHYLERLQTVVQWQPPNSYFHRHTFRYDAKEGCEVLDELAAIVNSSTGRLVQGAFCNYYHDGREYTPYHRDPYGCDIAGISFGTTRDFYFKADSGGGRTHYRLAHGDLLFFRNEVNGTHRHSVPARTRCHEERINITFFLR